MLAVLGLACATVAGVETAGPARPAAAQLAPGTLAIAAPTGVDLGQPAPGGAAAAGLGPVTVDDDRPVPGPTWSATVSATPLTTGAGTTAETIPAGAIAYASGPATATTGDGTFTAGQPSGAGVPLDGTVEAFRLEGATGRTTATWTPTIAVAVPASAVAGAYTGTITHSVA